MKVKFSIGYRTQWGQTIYVVGSAKELGGDNDADALALNPTSGELWEGEIEISAPTFSYRYFLKDQSGNILREYGSERYFANQAHFESAYLKDSWRPHGAMENSLYTSPFSKSLL